MVGSYQIMIKPVKVGKKSVRRSRPRKGLLVRGTFSSFGPKLKDPCYRHFTSKGLADAEEAERNGELDWKVGRSWPRDILRCTHSLCLYPILSTKSLGGRSIRLASPAITRERESGGPLTYPCSWVSG